MRLFSFLLSTSRQGLIWASIAGAISGVATVAMIALIRLALANFGQDPTTLIWAFAAICVVVLVSSIASQMVLVNLSQQAIFNLRQHLARQILAAPLRQLEQLGPPKLMALLTQDVDILANSLMIVPGLFISLAIIVTCFIYFLWMSWATFLAVLAFMVLGMLSYQLASLRAWKELKHARQEQNGLFAHLRGLTEGAKELKLHTSRSEAFMDENLGASALKYKKYNVMGLYIYSAATSWGQMLFFLLIAFLLFFLPKVQHMNYETVSGYVLVTLYLIAPLGNLLSILPVFGRASVSLKNLEDLGLTLKAEPVPETSAVMVRTETPFGEVKLVGVTHTYYQEGEDGAFTMGPIDLSFPPGELTFLIGGNGSGKTTLAKLIPLLYVPESGEIRLNGRPVTEGEREAYRNHFSMVFSDFFLFESLSGIGIDDREGMATRYLEKLRIANKVQVENGSFSTTALSQGQRKRLALLVSFLEDRDFYIFDEWASDQDPVFKNIFYTEILPELKSRGKTILVITHDDRYFGLADRLIKIESGQIQTDVYADQKAVAVAVGENIGGWAGTRASGNSGVRHEGRGLAENRNSIGAPVLVPPPAVVLAVSTPKARAGWAVSLGVLLFVLLFAWFGVLQQSVPPALPDNAPDGFSSIRAFQRLQQIAQRPHPPGTVDHARVRDYLQQEIASAGLSSDLQVQSVSDTAFNQRTGMFTSAGTVENIITTLKGTKNTKSVLVVAHYDSVATGPGAGDDGAGIAAALEVMRLLRAGPALQNDVTFLFSDGEETGLLGARAFIGANETSKIGVVLNFDARGVSGQELVIETGPENGWLIGEYASVAPYPSANSLSYELFKRLPNDTDFSGFKRAGIPGLNITLLDGYLRYHTMGDMLENVDRGSLQQLGSNMLALVRDLGNKDLTSAKSKDEIFFNVPGWKLIHYTSARAWSLTLAVVLLFVAAAWLGLRAREVTFRGMFFGAFTTVLSALVALAGVTGFWVVLIYKIHPDFRFTAGNSYHTSAYMAGLSALGVALAAWIYQYAFKRTKVLNLVLGASLFLTVLLLLATAFVPGITYIFAWPLLSCLAGVAFRLSSKRLQFGVDQAPGVAGIAVACICSVPALLIFVPVIYLIFVGATLLAGGIAAALIALLLAFLLPQLQILWKQNRWLVPAGALLISVCFLTAGTAASKFDRRHPRPDSLIYGLNADQQHASWMTIDTAADSWTAHFVPSDAKASELQEFFPWNFRKYRQADAPAVSLAPPVMEVLEDRTANGERTVRIRIRSQRQAPELFVSTASGDQVREARLDGKVLGGLESMPKVLRDRKLWGFDYVGLPKEGIELVLRIAPGPMRLNLVDGSYGFPDELHSSMEQRPPDSVPRPFPVNDKTFVTRSLTF
jgi:putative ATP-binding cassette transporter